MKCCLVLNKAWWTLEDEDSPKSRKTNRNDVLLEDNVSSESEEEFLCKKNQKSGKLKIDFEFNITWTVTHKYNNKNGSAWNELLIVVNFCNEMQRKVCFTWQGRCRFWSLLDYILGGHIWPEKSRRDRTITQIHTIINTVIINQLLFIFHFIKILWTPMLNPNNAQGKHSISSPITS